MTTTATIIMKSNNEFYKEITGLYIMCYINSSVYYYFKSTGNYLKKNLLQSALNVMLA